MIRILNAEAHGYCEEARTILKELGALTEGDLNREELLAQIGEHDVLIVRLAHQVDRDVIDAGHHLKAIVSATTGLDHIDVAYAQSRGIKVLSLKGETAFLDTVWATVEHTWALLLALQRHIPHAYASVQRGEWDRDRFRGCELYGKRLGIVGLGRIGRKVARYGLAFHMDVLAYDPYATAWVDGVTRCPTLASVLSQSDVLTLHVPLNDETEGCIGAEELARLPEGAVLINTARGAVLDEGALVGALESGHLAGAALDVICYEREAALRRSSPLLVYAATHHNLLVTPHIGGATFDSMAKTEVFMARTLASVLRTANAAVVDAASTKT